MGYDWDRFQSFIAERLQSKHVPGAAICVSDETGVLYSNGFGHRDAQRSLKVTPDTIFGIASMSKSITCLAAALLEHEGKLSFSDPVSKYLPEFRIPGTPKEAVLVHHLATHTTGIPPLPTLSWSRSWHTAPEPWNRESREKLKAEAKSKVESVDDIIAYLSQSNEYSVLGPPGRYMSYLNEGYALLSSVIDQAAGETLESYVDRRIFQPLGMGRSTFDLDVAVALGNITSLFIKDEEGVLRCTDHWDVAPPYRGCGWVKSTAVDMNKYYLALSQGGMYEGRRVFPASAVERVVGRGFAEVESGVYCYGLNKRLFRGVAICEHSGGLTGVSSRGGFIKDQSFAVTVLTNLSGIDCAEMTNAALNVRLGLPLDRSHMWATPTGEALDDASIYAGVYRSREGMGTELVIEVAANGSLVCSSKGNSEPILFCGGNVFVPSGSGKVLSPGQVLQFHICAGQRNMVSVGSRIFQQVAEV
jgi:CubicO group peptidase (beta-lactamase class C family)